MYMEILKLSWHERKGFTAISPHFLRKWQGGCQGPIIGEEYLWSQLQSLVHLIISSKDTKRLVCFKSWYSNLLMAAHVYKERRPSWRMKLKTHDCKVYHCVRRHYILRRLLSRYSPHQHVFYTIYPSVLSLIHYGTIQDIIWFISMKESWCTYKRKCVDSFDVFVHVRM